MVIGYGISTDAYSVHTLCDLHVHIMCPKVITVCMFSQGMCHIRQLIKHGRILFSAHVMTLMTYVDRTKSLENKTNVMLMSSVTVFDYCQGLCFHCKIKGYQQ